MRIISIEWETRRDRRRRKKKMGWGVGGLREACQRAVAVQSVGRARGEWGEVGGGISGASGELVGRTRAQGWCGESAGFYIGPRGAERLQSAAFSWMARIYEGT